MDLDRGKPEAVLTPQVFEYELDSQTRSSDSPDPENVVETRRERRGESLWRVLYERHINMITFSGTIGNGLFLGSGTSLALGGPGGAVLAYVLMGTVISSVISCLGEMTALMPVNAPVIEFPRRFLDRGVGFAVGYAYWFAWSVTVAEELVAIAQLLRFTYDDGTTYLKWVVGNEVDPAVWVGTFLIIVTILNMFPVRYFGELEYIFGSIKITFITMLILMMLIIDVMKPRSNAYYQEPLGTKYWNTPWSFFNPVYHVTDENGELQREITGGAGKFLAMWTTLINVIFSYTGMDIVAATASESKALANAESMKMAARKICIRIISLYTFAMFTASFLVPYNHPFINGGGQSVGSKSIFIIAVVQAGIPTVAHVFNAVFVFSSFTCAINSMYVGSRVLHTLALHNQTGPEWITRRLRQCHNGVPIRAVLATGLIAMVAFMGRSGAPGTRLKELSGNAVSSILIVYIVICATYLRFFQVLQEEKENGNASEAQAASYDRDHARYPYKSHGQWLKAAYGMVACTILLLFNGVGPCLERPFDTHKFVAQYISIPVFIALLLGYKIHKHGLRIHRWGPERSNDLRNTIQAASVTRKGRLEFPDDTWFSRENVRVFGRWIWVWLK